MSSCSDGVRGYTAFHRTPIAFLSGLCTDCHPTNWLTPPLSLFLSLSLFYLPLLETSALSLDLSPLPLTQAGYPVGYQRSHRRALIRVSVG